MLCGVCYRPPNQSSDDLFLNLFQASLDSINLSNNFSTVIVLGDFNAHYNYSVTSSLNTDVGVKLYNFLDGNNLTILDLSITDSPGHFISTGTLSPLANCDHIIIYANMDIALSKPKSFKRIVRNYKNVDVNGLIAALLNANWNDVFINSLDTIDSVYDKWLNY